MAKNKSAKRKKGPSMAEKADRHVLYEKAVQCVEAEIDFVDETFEQIRGRRARYLREDFCGTANTSCEWVRRRSDNVAIGVDLDAEVLAWGREHNVAALDGASERVELVQGDVRKAPTRPVDIVLAMNFSYYCFRTREDLRGYFRAAREHLTADGLFFLDAFGGYEAFRELKERTDYKGFSYIWHQAHYNPINGDTVCHINFRFPDGSRLDQAFSYRWRMWTLPEIRELLAEAGFRRSTVYWEGTDEDSGEGNGEFFPTEEGEADAGWICYVVAEP